MIWMGPGTISDATGNAHAFQPRRQHVVVRLVLRLGAEQRNTPCLQPICSPLRHDVASSFSKRRMRILKCGECRHRPLQCGVGQNMCMLMCLAHVDEAQEAEIDCRKRMRPFLVAQACVLCFTHACGNLWQHCTACVACFVQLACG